MVCTDENCGETSPQIGPFPVSVRSSRRRRSRLARPLTPPSACEESAHYPVFNPEDPRHNPTLERDVCLEPVEGLQPSAQPTGSMRWMHGLPGRSLRRARSGFQALRSGLHRRPSRSADESHVINGLWSSSDSAEGSSDPHERFFSSTVSEASTEEDYEFGTGLYRTGCNCPGPKNAEDKDISLPSYILPANLDPLPRLSTGANMPLILPMETIASASPAEGLFSAETSPNTTDLSTVEHWPTTEKLSTVERWPATEESHSTARSVTIERLSAGERSPITEHEDQLDTSKPRISRLDDTPSANANCQSLLDSANTLKLPASNVTHQVLMQGLLAPNISSTASCVSGCEPDPATKAKDTQSPVGKTNVSRLSRTSSLFVPTQIEQLPCGETEVTVTTEEFRSVGVPEADYKAELIGEEIEPTSVTERAPVNMAHALPEVELGGLASMEYYLSLDTLGASEESKTSDEEHSPDSLIDNDRHVPLNPWLPTDKGDRTSLLSLRDEYFLIDGKSTDLRPDRGDNPIKGERGFAGDGGLHSGPGLDRNLSVRTQDIPEIIGPGGPMSAPSPRTFPRDREGSDSTEEYLVTYSLLHRHYFS